MAKAKKKTASKKKAAPQSKASSKKTAKKAIKKTPIKLAIKKSMAKKTSSAPVKKVATKTRPTAKPAVVAKKTVSQSSAIKPVKAAPVLTDFSQLITPLDDRVLVRLVEGPRQTAGGLFIPDTVNEVTGPLRGLVVSVGRGHRDKKGRLRPLDVKMGDQVLFASFSGSKIQFNSEELLLVRESELMGVTDGPQGK